MKYKTEYGWKKGPQAGRLRPDMAVQSEESKRPEMGEHKKPARQHTDVLTDE